MIHNVFAGNPGTGKSTLLNTFLGEPKFAAGPKLGDGMTFALQTVESNGELYSDTPGLDDISIRQQAAHQISLALTAAGTLRLFFVCTLEAGRVRPADVVTIETVLAALTHAGVDVNGKFSLILNKCDKRVLTAMNQDEVSRRFVINAFSCQKDLQHYFLCKRHKKYDSKADVLLPTKDGALDRFIRNAPVMEKAMGSNVSVDMKVFDNRLEELEKGMDRVRDMMRKYETAKTGEERRNAERQLINQFILRGALVVTLDAAKRLLFSWATRSLLEALV